MRQTVRLGLVLFVAACGNQGTSSLDACTNAGDCPGDMPAPPPPNDIAAPTCSPPCARPMPYCNDALVCVACLVDSHCPTGQVCEKRGDTSLCVEGCADDARCQGDGGATQRCCNKHCVDTATDASNCGACGNVCTGIHSQAACSESQCQAGTCDKGWGDCNHDAKDGCETNVRIDAANCGACNMTCSIPNALSACSDGCYLAACNFGWDDCNGDSSDGCEQDVTKDMKNCGGCGVVCNNRPHARNSCVASSCVVTACDPGYTDCNGDPDDGCEIATLTDLKNCGMCGNACAMGLVCVNGSCTCPQCNIPNAKSKCINGVCTLDSCLAGFADCDKNAANGCEVEIARDPKNCGACGNACGGMAQYCKAGMCTANPCTGKVGGVILMVMPMPMYGFCWYLSSAGSTCDAVCAASGGTNEANAALTAFDDDCNGGVQGQPATWFYQNGNACGWTMTNGAPTGYLSLGHGYNNQDTAGRQPVYMGKCNQGGLRNVGCMPGDSNDSTSTGNSRCVVCACSH